MRIRTYLLGAGFSKAVADGPLMYELWEFIKREYELQLTRKVPKKNWLDNRRNKFIRLKAFVENLESESKLRFSQLNFDSISTNIRTNIEYLLTLIDLFLEGPEVSFEKEDSDVEPYPMIPFQNTSRLDLQHLKSAFKTYMYLIFHKLQSNELAELFAKIIDVQDEFITFNYDLVLEKLLLKHGLWSPLDGYINIGDFENENDYLVLTQNKFISKVKIYKLHGSINWEASDYNLDFENKIYISMDDIESQNFYLDINLGRETHKISAMPEIGYLGAHRPVFIPPSYVKPFNNRQISQIWKSAILRIAQTHELVIIGYSFRSEDSNSALLISSLPNNSIIKIVDPNSQEIILRLKNFGLDNEFITYSSLEEFVKSFH